MGIRIPFENFLLLALIPMGIEIPLRFITLTEKWNFGQFWLGVISPMEIPFPKGINQFLTFDFNSR